jgi:small subunit ribosomal protein S16
MVKGLPEPCHCGIPVNRAPLPGRGKLKEDFMSARIRLKKFGTKKRPYYRIVVMDNRAPRDGKTIEELGYYHPIEAEDKQILFDADKVKAWLQNGATVSDTVRKILNKKNVSL